VATTWALQSVQRAACILKHEDCQATVTPRPLSTSLTFADTLSLLACLSRSFSCRLHGKQHPGTRHHPDTSSHGRRLQLPAQQAAKAQDIDLMLGAEHG
jgi:hypothetical protein